MEAAVAAYAPRAVVFAAAAFASTWDVVCLALGAVTASHMPLDDPTTLDAVPVAPRFVAPALLLALWVRHSGRRVAPFELGIAAQASAMLLLPSTPLWAAFSVVAGTRWCEHRRFLSALLGVYIACGECRVMQAFIPTLVVVAMGARGSPTARSAFLRAFAMCVCVYLCLYFVVLHRNPDMLAMLAFGMCFRALGAVRFDRRVLADVVGKIVGIALALFGVWDVEYVMLIACGATFALAIPIDDDVFASDSFFDSSRGAYDTDGENFGRWLIDSSESVSGLHPLVFSAAAETAAAHGACLSLVSSGSNDPSVAYETAVAHEKYALTMQKLSKNIRTVALEVELERNVFCNVSSAFVDETLRKRKILYSQRQRKLAAELRQADKKTAQRMAIAENSLSAAERVLDDALASGDLSVKTLKKQLEKMMERKSRREKREGRAGGPAKNLIYLSRTESVAAGRTLTFKEDYEITLKRLGIR